MHFPAICQVFARRILSRARSRATCRRSLHRFGLPRDPAIIPQPSQLISQAKYQRSCNLRSPQRKSQLRFPLPKHQLNIGQVQAQPLFRQLQIQAQGLPVCLPPSPAAAYFLRYPQQSLCLAFIQVKTRPTSFLVHSQVSFQRPSLATAQRTFLHSVLQRYRASFPVCQTNQPRHPQLLFLVTAQARDPLTLFRVRVLPSFQRAQRLFRHSVLQRSRASFRACQANQPRHPQLLCLATVQARDPPTLFRVRVLPSFQRLFLVTTQRITRLQIQRWYQAIVPACQGLQARHPQLRYLVDARVRDPPTLFQVPILLSFQRPLRARTRRATRQQLLWDIPVSSQPARRARKWFQRRCSHLRVQVSYC